MMKVCLIAPTIYALGGDGYGGIERLVVLFARGLLGRGHQISVFCCNGTVLPRGVRVYYTGPQQDFREPNLFPTIVLTSPYFGDIYLDFSHSKPLGRLTGLRHISPIWHDPVIMVPPQPKQNVVALSQWQADRFKQVYSQDIRVLDPICADGDYFVPGDKQEDFVLFIGILSPEKGALEAVQACKALGQKLKLVGPVTSGCPQDYVQAVKSACDGLDIIYEGEVSEAHKLDLIQRARCLLYPVSYPAGQGESHSHKSIEAMLCGLPCVAYGQGAMAEVIDHGVTGFVISGREELTGAIEACETLDRTKCRERALERWDYRQVIKRWEPVMERVVQGERW